MATPEIIGSDVEQGFELDKVAIDIESGHEIRIENVLGSGLEEPLIEETQFDLAAMKSLIEATLFASERPVSLYSLKALFHENEPTSALLKKILLEMSEEYEAPGRGFCLVELGQSYQLRTKSTHIEILRKNVKPRHLKLSTPAMEVLALVAYRQPLTKGEIDMTRGVESGHLLRILIEKSLVTFGGKSDLPGKPMQYVTTKKFLEVFSLRNLEELPTLEQIKELLPDGIDGDAKAEGQTWDDINGESPITSTTSYSAMAEAAEILADQLSQIDTTSAYLKNEEDKKKRSLEEAKANSLREKLVRGEALLVEEEKWLVRYDRKLQKSISSD